jgi:tetratricopeptide (TPR) repeat protein
MANLDETKTSQDIEKLLELAKEYRQDCEYVDAERCLTEARTNLENQPRSPGVARMLSRALYESGYIHYLKGEFTEAIDLLTSSADVATSAGYETSAAMSRCVAGYVAAMAGLAKVDDFDPEAVATVPEVHRYMGILDESLAVFGAHQDESVNVRSWLTNNPYDQIEAATWAGDRERAVKYAVVADEIERQTTLNRPYNLKSLVQARLSLLSHNWEDACEHFEQYIRSLDARMRPLSTREAGAYVAWQHGMYYLKAGRSAEAIEIFENALTFRDDLANHIWKAKIRKRLHALTVAD